MLVQGKSRCPQTRQTLDIVVSRNEMVGIVDRAGLTKMATVFIVVGAVIDKVLPVLRKEDLVRSTMRYWDRKDKRTSDIGCAMRFRRRSTGMGGQLSFSHQTPEFRLDAKAYDLLSQAL
ncbi:hypothetical protein N7535_006420 [Penicillium sp. DV-2018c]|nr:hypothetical protein N7535_006420 [Penicillium sp. DV-2018c]